MFKLEKQIFKRIKFLKIIFIALISFCLVEKIEAKVAMLDKKVMVKCTDFDAELAITWNKLLFDIFCKTDGYRVTVATRVLAYVNWAAYEAIVPTMQKYKSIAQQKKDVDVFLLPKNNQYSSPISANSAYRRTILHYFPTIDKLSRLSIDSLYAFFENKYSKGMSFDNIEASKQFGELTAEKIIEYSALDNGAFTFMQNKPFAYHFNLPSGEGLWNSTYPDFLFALTPYWGNVKPILIDTNRISFNPPITFSKNKNSSFYNQAFEVYQKTLKVSDEECFNAEFWSDDIQFISIDAASRWVSIACQLLEKENSNLEDASFLLAQLSIGLFDGSILCWKEKYHFNVLRPVSYIRENIDNEWITNLIDIRKGGIKDIGITPAHPSYPSGHSVFGAIGALILENYFGEKKSIDNSTFFCRNSMNNWSKKYDSFQTMMLENAYSRIPLGVHYRMDCDEGLRIGKLVAQDIIQAHWYKKIE